VLAALGATLGGIAGCGARQSEPSPTERPPTATDTPTPQATPTPAPTDAPTATEAEASVGITTVGEPVHGLDERFVVEGQPSVAYRVNGLRRADRLGPIGREPDQGAFLVVDCTVESLANGPIAVPIEDIVLRGGVRLFARQDDTDAASADRRVDLPPLTDETLFPNDPLRGVLAFDLPTTAGNDYYLRITPPGDADTPAHRVTVGRLESIDPLD
jgi:hypothetical protein